METTKRELSRYVYIQKKLESLGAWYGEMATEYAEPGYAIENHFDIVLFGNWNKCPKGLIEAFKEHEIALDWSDEYIFCDDCMRPFRTVGDCWQWTMYGHIFDGTALCGDCIKENPQEYIESLIDNPENCEHIGLDLQSLNFKQLNGDFDAGMYEWQFGENHDPHAIMKKWKEKYPDMEMIFGNIQNEQFQTRFNLYGREKGETK
jgi:hypothetical protein